MAKKDKNHGIYYQHGSAALTLAAIGEESFYKWKSPYRDGTSNAVDELSGLRVLQVNTLPSLIQAMGYLKYILDQDGYDVYYRGQSELFKAHGIAAGKYLFQASVLRGAQTSEVIKRRLADATSKVGVLKRMCPKLIEEGCGDHVLEGLLQQYGIKTSWLDVVDNIWVALWFACFNNDKPILADESLSVDGARSFYHMTPRTVSEDEKYAYLIFMKVPRRGLVISNRAEEIELLDLRCKVPSMFTRPHMQHGLLVRPANRYQSNMASLICGIVRLDLSAALRRLGDGRMLSSESMVPPPNYDLGFRYLLDCECAYRQDDVIRFPIYC